MSTHHLLIDVIQHRLQYSSQVTVVKFKWGKDGKCHICIPQYRVVNKEANLAFTSAIKSFDSTGTGCPIFARVTSTFVAI